MFVRQRATFEAIARKGLAATLPFALGLILGFAPQPAAAGRHHHAHAGHAAVGLTDPSKDAALILDGETGKVLYARNATDMRYPASLTKLMTLYMLFEALQKGQMTLQTPMTVSAHAADQAPVKLHLAPGDTITVEQAIKAIVVRSANDVAVVIAESVGGSESNFAAMMTAKARQLGMTHTHYVNASGLPNREQVTTASDLGLLARHIAYDFPQFYHYFASESFTFRGHSWDTHDNLIGKYDGADGMKTGYTVMSGFNLVSSVVRGGAHVIGVVMGGRTARKRDTEMMRLLDDTFARISNYPTLVARAEVPWHTIADGPRANPIIAGFDIGSGLAPHSQARTVIASAAPDLRPAGSVDPNDEDTAEAEPDNSDANDDALANMIAPQPAPRPKAAQVAAYQPTVSAPQPTPRPKLAQVAAYQPILLAPQPTPRPKMTLAAYQPTVSLPQPGARPSLRYQSDGVAPSAMTTLGLHDWTIQIGAYADPKMARAQLASYAEKSMDILGQAARIVLPFQSIDGHTLYRARFGPFVEGEARKVCERLTERGQTCFAAIAVR